MFFLFYLFYIIEILFNNCVDADIGLKDFLRFNGRSQRQCYNTGQSVMENPLYLFFMIIIIIVIILLFLGLMKGIIGYYWSKRIGEYGLALLVDLPKHLDSYQEKELREKRVVYDIAGWPVHPKTKQRTVRVLPLKTEFCLNFIFFLTCPLALILKVFSLVCCIRKHKQYEELHQPKKKFKCINRCGRKKNNPKESPGAKVDKYKTNDRKEIKDTKYVVHMMKESQISLQNLSKM